ncbi:Uncharacterised protein [Flavobacterium hibernum]|nr:Uncharacterised protein [Flavobacterium hibernum]
MSNVDKMHGLLDERHFLIKEESLVFLIFNALELVYSC